MKTDTQSAIDAAKSAELHYVELALTRAKAAFDFDVESIADEFEILLDPQAKLSVGVLKAVDRISQKRPDFFALPAGGHKPVNLELPGVPTFPHYHDGASGSPALESVLPYSE